MVLFSFRAKISKYGDRVLETIESTIKEYYKTDKNSSSSNDSVDTTKRRRESAKVLHANPEEDDVFTKSTDRSRVRAMKRPKKRGEVNNIVETYYYNQCLDDDLDFEDSTCDVAINESASKADRDDARRTLPSWSTPSNRGRNQHVNNTFQEYSFKG